EPSPNGASSAENSPNEQPDAGNGKPNEGGQGGEEKAKAGENAAEEPQERFWVWMHPLPPRFGYIQIKKLCRDLLGSDRDLITGETLTERKCALIAMSTKEIADKLAVLLKETKTIPNCPHMDAEVLTEEARVERFGQIQHRQHR
ncbi:unnamed protein product, partial [Polarella glacialis]